MKLIKVPLKNGGVVIANTSAIKQIVATKNIVEIFYKDGTEHHFYLEEGKRLEVIGDQAVEHSANDNEEWRWV